MGRRSGGDLTKGEQRRSPPPPWGRGLLHEVTDATGAREDTGGLPSPVPHDTPPRRGRIRCCVLKAHRVVLGPRAPGCYTEDGRVVRVEYFVIPGDRHVIVYEREHPRVES